MLLKRYYTISEISLNYQCSRTHIEDLIKCFRVKTKVCNNMIAVSTEEMLKFEEYFKLKKASGMTNRYIKQLPKFIIKQLIERL